MTTRTVAARRALLCTLVFALAVVLAAPASARRKDKKAGGIEASGEVFTLKRKEKKKKTDEKGAEKKKQEEPRAVEQRRDREDMSNIDDLEDELDILYELLEIERGSPTEADTLLEMSYVLWDRANAFELEAFDEQFTVGIPKAREEGREAEARRLKVEQQELKEEARLTKEEVIESLKRIERRFPDFKKLDEVLYSLGFHLDELERHGESVDAYMRLVRKRPQSSYIPDAYLGIGTYYFGKNEGQEAVRWFKKALQFKDAPTYGWALYYIAWTHYNRQDYDVATEDFVKVLHYSFHEAGPRVKFVADGKKYLARAWAEIGKPQNAEAYFKEKVPGHEDEMLEALARRYTDVAKYRESNVILEGLLARTLPGPQRISLLYLKLDNHYRLADLDGTGKTATDVMVALDEFGGDGISKQDRAGLAVLLAEIASNYHAEAERTQNKAMLQSAEKVYRAYLQHFEDHKYAYDMLHNHALSLFQLQRWVDSAERYERVIDMKPDGKYAEPSAHRALIAYVRLQDLENNKKGDDKAASEEGAVMTAVPLTDDQKGVIRACDRYVAIAKKNKKDEDVPEALFVKARIYYQSNYFDDAAKGFKAFIDSYPKHPELATDAAWLLVSSYELGQDGKNLIDWTDRFMTEKRFAHLNVGPFAERLIEIKQNEDYNKCIAMRDKPAEAAVCLIAYGDREDFALEMRARAYAGAVRFYRMAAANTARSDVAARRGLMSKTVATAEALAKKFPGDARGPEALFQVGEMHREVGDFAAAASAYEKLAETFPKAERTADALALATRFRKGLGDPDKVVANGELRLSRKQGDKAEAAEVAYELTVAYLKAEEWRKAIRASQKFLRKSDDIPQHLRMAALSNTGLAWLRSSSKSRAKKYIDEVLEMAETLATEGKFKELPEIGKAAVAQALFVRGEVAFEDLKKVRMRNVGLKAAVKIAATQAKIAQEADGFYAQAEDARNAQWVAAAASRRGRIWQTISESLEQLPPPPAFRRSFELREEWKAQMIEKAEPFKDKALEGYRKALKKAAELYAFDAYWAEARDNLIKLDTDFASIATIAERTVALSAVTWTGPDPATAAGKRKIAELIDAERARLFARNENAAGVEVKPSGDTTGDAAPKGPSPTGESFKRMATSLHMLGKHHEALLVGIAGIQADEALRRDGELLTTLGLSQMALKKIREALLLWEKAAEADPAANDALLNMATVRIKQLDFEGAETLLRKVLDRDANNCAALYTLPVALRRLDKKDEALAMLEQATSTCKASVPAHFNRCVIAQALLSGSKKEVGQAKDICSASLAAVASGTPEHSELKKRVDGLTMAYEFMEDAPAAPATPAPPADGAAPAADEAAPAAEAAPSEDAKPANDAPADAEPKPAQEEPPAAAEPTP